MTRAEALALYRPIRAGIQAVLRRAPAACTRTDLLRAHRQVAPWATLEDLEEGQGGEMLLDVALFEPNQRGRRAFDRFLADKGERLPSAERVLAGRMAGAWFSIFRLAGRHPSGGVGLEDLLDGGRRLWLMDEGLEASAPDGAVLGMRLFDAGPFHAGFGILVAPDDETLDLCVDARARGQPLPFRHPLAATLYGDALRGAAPPSPSDIALLATLIESLEAAPRPGPKRRVTGKPARLSPPRPTPPARPRGAPAASPARRGRGRG